MFFISFFFKFIDFEAYTYTYTQLFNNSNFWSSIFNFNLQQTITQFLFQKKILLKN